jgi:hypothetical protein
MTACQIICLATERKKRELTPTPVSDFYHAWLALWLHVWGVE